MKPVICGDNAEIYIPASGCSDCEQVEQELQEFKGEVETALEGKQNVLRAGDNISIAQNGTISATDTTYNPATTSTDGLMSATDKTKLDGITWTKAGILAALGYEEVTLELTDANGNSVTKTILAAVE